MRRAQATMSSGRRGNLIARLISSLSPPSSSPARIACSTPVPRPRNHSVGGIRVPASVRHLLSVAERADVPPDHQGPEYAPHGFRRQPWAVPDQRYPSGFNEEGSRNSHGFPPSDRGFDGQSSSAQGGTSAGYQHLDGARNWQQNLYDSARGSNLDPSVAAVNGGGFQGTNNAYGFGHPLPGVQGEGGIHGFSDEQRTEDTADDGRNLHVGTIEELDAFLLQCKAKEAVQVLGLLEKQGKVLDLDRCLKLLDVCGDARAADEARAVHHHLINTIGGGDHNNVPVRINNRLLSVYCKCESVEDARKLFDAMPERNLTSWETMMLGLADNGLGEDAIDLFTEFTDRKGLTPDGHMFVALFRVCASLGAVDEGMLHFRSMTEVYGISPSAEHYASVVRMHGEAGYLDEALDFIVGKITPPRESSSGRAVVVVVWESLMHCARIQGDVELGDRCAEIVELLEPGRLSGESKAGLLPVKASDLAREKQRKANLLEVRSRVHEYRAGDTSHPEKDRIYALIKGLAGTLREGGYVPDTRFVLHDVEQESKEEALLAHSERLATAYGLISSSARSPIRIIKNLRICGDCHSYMKVLSKAAGRELIIRDAKRFHHFKDGVCSCRDYW